TALHTFEGLSVRGGALPEGAADEPAGPFLTPRGTAAYADFCRGNLLALLVGATPSYSFPRAPPGHANAGVRCADRAGAGERLQVSHLSLRPPVPLQATLFQLTQAAAQALAAGGMSDGDLETLRVGVTVLYAPAMHGTVREPDLRGLDVRRR